MNFRFCLKKMTCLVVNILDYQVQIRITSIRPRMFCDEKKIRDKICFIEIKLWRWVQIILIEKLVLPTSAQILNENDKLEGKMSGF
jgi:hypothetical protein